MKYHFKIHKEKKGYSAECVELSGCITQGDSMKELMKNMEEVLNLYIEEPADSKRIAALPDSSIRKSKNIIEVELDPSSALAFMVRRSRLEEGLTQQAAAKRLGFDNVFSYQRLESKYCNPTFKILSQIKKGFPGFSVDATF